MLSNFCILLECWHTIGYYQSILLIGFFVWKLKELEEAGEQDRFEFNWQLVVAIDYRVDYLSKILMPQLHLNTK